jgi:hypothetical protein
MRKTLNKKAFLRTALEALGPIVVNKDGSLARISNWGKMTEQEQEATKRCGIHKRLFWTTFLYNTVIYQDRLGTNMGQAHQKRLFPAD